MINKDTISKKKILIYKIIFWIFLTSLFFFSILLLGSKYINWDYLLKEKVNNCIMGILPEQKFDFSKLELNILHRELKIKNFTFSIDRDINKDDVGLFKTSVIESIIIPFSIKNFFIKQFKISKVTLVAPKISIDRKDNLINLFINNNSIKINIIDGNLVIDNLLSNFNKNINDINGYIEYKNVNELNIELKSKIGNNNYDIVANKRNDILMMNVNNAANNFLIEIKQSDNLMGTISGDGSNFWHLLSDLLMTKRSNPIPFYFNDDIFQLNFDFIWKDSLLEVRDFSLKGNLYDLNLSLINDNIKDSQLLDININKLNCESLIQENKEYAESENMSLLNFFPHIDEKYVLHANINIKDFFYNQNKFSSVIAFDVVNQSIILNKFLADFNKDNRIAIQGDIVTKDYNQMQFLGKIDIDGDDINSFFKLIKWNDDIHYLLDISDEHFSFNADFEMVPLMTKLTNLSLKVDDYNFHSNSLLYKKYKDGGLILGDFNSDIIKINTSNIKKYLKDRIIYIKNYIKLYKKDLNISSNINFLQYDNKKVGDIVFDTHIARDKITINNIKIDSDQELGGYFNFYNRVIRPIVVVNMKVDILPLILQSWRDDNLDKHDIFKKIDLDLNLQANQIKGQDIILKNFLLHVNIDKNIAVFDKIIFDIFNGNVHLVSLFDLSNFLFQSNIKIENINLSLLSKLSRWFDFDSGTFSLNGYMKSYGKNVNQIIRQLYGQLKTVGNNVAIKNFNIDYLATNLIKMNNGDDIENLIERTLYGGRTNINNFYGDFVIQNGLMKSNLKMTSDYTAGNFMGNIDILDRSVDGLVRFIFRPNYLNKKKKNEQFAVDVKVKGIINSPERYIDADVLKRYLFMGINPFKKKSNL